MGSQFDIYSAAPRWKFLKSCFKNLQHRCGLPAGGEGRGKEGGRKGEGRGPKGGGGGGGGGVTPICKSYRYVPTPKGIIFQHF